MTFTFAGLAGLVPAAAGEATAPMPIVAASATATSERVRRPRTEMLSS